MLFTCEDDQALAAIIAITSPFCVDIDDMDPVLVADDLRAAQDHADHLRGGREDHSDGVDYVIMFPVAFVLETEEDCGGQSFIGLVGA